MTKIKEEILEMLEEALNNATTDDEYKGIQRAIDIIEEVYNE